MITQMRRISLFLGGAGEVGGIVGVAGAFVFRDLRIGANRARKFHAARGIETGVLGGDERRRSRALFDPKLEGSLDIVLCVLGAEKGQRTEGVRARAAIAVLDAGKHIKTSERIGLLAAEFGTNGVPVIDGIDRADRGIVPAVIKDDFSAMHFKRSEIGIGGVQDFRGLFVGKFHGLREVGGLCSPLAVFVDDVREVVVGESADSALPLFGTDYPGEPAMKA